MPTLKLTAVAVERLKAPATGQIEYFDAAYPALALRITSNDIRSWVYFGRLHGRLKRVTLGRWPGVNLTSARQKAAQTAEDLKQGIDVTAEKKAARRQAERNGFEAVMKEWLARDQAGNRSRAGVERALNKDVLPRWRDRPIETIGRRDCLDVIDGVADRGSPVMARRLHAYLHRLFKWATGRGIIEHNPMDSLPKPGAERPRDRVLSDQELREVWHAAGLLGFPFGPAYRLLILTGARRDEIASLTWKEVDLGRAEIRLDGARTKNGKPHMIPLVPAALDILENLPRVKPEKEAPPYAFTTTGTTPVSGWGRSKSLLDAKVLKLRREAAVETGDDSESVNPPEPWRVHDLRRTLATGLQRLGCRLEVIESVLGHVGGSRAGIVGIYQRHAFEPEKRRALEKWARHMLKVAGHRAKDKVVQLHPAENA